jgi:hypothetical protein
MLKVRIELHSTQPVSGARTGDTEGLCGSVCREMSCSNRLDSAMVSMCHHVKAVPLHVYAYVCV